MCLSFIELAFNDLTDFKEDTLLLKTIWQKPWDCRPFKTVHLYPKQAIERCKNTIEKFLKVSNPILNWITYFFLFDPKISL